MIRPRSRSSPVTAPTVALVTPSCLVSAERVGARPVWIRVSAAPGSETEASSAPIVHISINLYPCFVQLLYKLPLPLTARNETSRARIAITAFFAIDGFVFANWAVRIPAVKAAVGASPATLGMALLGVSAGAIATMALTGALCRRFGSATVTGAAATRLSLALLLPPLAHSALTLGLGLAVFGIGYGGLNVAMNAVAVDVVKLSG